MKLDVTRNFIRARIRSPKDFVQGSFQWHSFSVTKGIHAVVASVCDDCALQVQSLVFEKARWTEQSVLQWVQRHRAQLCRMTPRCLK